MNFKITYEDPESFAIVTIEKEFNDTPMAKIETDGAPNRFISISAKEWAEDYAYTISNKGWYKIEQIDL